MNPVTEIHPIMIWALIIVSISLVAGITYVYTNRNNRITLLFTLGSIFLVGMMKIISIINIELDQNFLGKYDSPDSTSTIAGPGWSLLLYAWHIWILPVILVCFIFFIIIYLILTYKKSGAPKLEVHSPIIPAQAEHEQTRAEKLNVFMMVDAAKKQSRLANQKLTESLLANAANEIKISELTSRVTSLESDLENMEKASQEQIITLQSTLDAKNKEVELVNHQLLSVNQDLEKAKSLLKKLAEFNKRKTDPDN